MKKYCFFDVDGDDVDVESDLNYLFDRLDVMSILFDYGMQKGFSNSVLSTLWEYLDSVRDCSFELVNSLHCCNSSRQSSAGMTADVAGNPSN